MLRLHLRCNSLFLLPHRLVLHIVFFIIIFNQHGFLLHLGLGWSWDLILLVGLFLGLILLISISDLISLLSFIGLIALIALGILELVLIVVFLFSLLLWSLFLLHFFILGGNWLFLVIIFARDLIIIILYTSLFLEWFLSIDYWCILLGL